MATKHKYSIPFERGGRTLFHIGLNDFFEGTNITFFEELRKGVHLVERFDGHASLPETVTDLVRLNLDVILYNLP